MATAFDRWEKDPFFYAAEEVQESADRLESVYRQWLIHEKKPTGGVADSPVTVLRRELSTALGTAKWQLEELERAVRSCDHSLSAGESTVARHSDFIVAISSKISIVENALKEMNQEEVGRSDLTWVRLDEGERDELALFLSPPKTETEVVVPSPSFHESGSRMNGETSVCFSTPCTSNDSSPPEMKGENRNGHRRVASSCSDLGLWKISISSERSPRKEPALPIARILSLAELRTMETSTKPKWYRYGFRKWKVISNESLEEKLPFRNHHLRGMDICYEKSKSCLSDWDDESYSKQLHGWFGAFQRRIQRSQYQIQYGRPTQIIVWTFATVLLVVILVLRVT